MNEKDRTQALSHDLPRDLVSESETESPRQHV